ncbi:MAG: AtpZ/AtpI family protein [Actinobacteria bacterium]|nr:AtpZ/AtpI family protein [Actinomycetota bacterium]
MQQAETRELKQGFGDAAAAAFELAVTPAIFGVLGWLLDRAVGTSPVFTIGFVLVTAGYSVWRLAHDYRINLDREAASRREAWQARGPLVP